MTEAVTIQDLEARVRALEAKFEVRTTGYGKQREAILNALVPDKFQTARELSAVLGLPKDSVAVTLSALKAEGLCEHLQRKGYKALASVKVADPLDA